MEVNKHRIWLVAVGLIVLLFFSLLLILPSKGFVGQAILSVGPNDLSTPKSIEVEICKDKPYEFTIGKNKHVMEVYHKPLDYQASKKEDYLDVKVNGECLGQCGYLNEVYSATSIDGYKKLIQGTFKTGFINSVPIEYSIKNPGETTTSCFDLKIITGSSQIEKLPLQLSKGKISVVNVYEDVDTLFSVDGDEYYVRMEELSHYTPPGLKNIIGFGGSLIVGNKDTGKEIDFPIFSYYAVNEDLLTINHPDGVDFVFTTKSFAYSVLNNPTIYTALYGEEELVHSSKKSLDFFNHRPLSKATLLVKPVKEGDEEVLSDDDPKSVYVGVGAIAGKILTLPETDSSAGSSATKGRRC